MLPDMPVFVPFPELWFRSCHPKLGFWILNEATFSGDSLCRVDFSWNRKLDGCFYAVHSTAFWNIRSWIILNSSTKIGLEAYDRISRRILFIWLIQNFCVNSDSKSISPSTEANGLTKSCMLMGLSIRHYFNCHPSWLWLIERNSLLKLSTQARKDFFSFVLLGIYSLGIETCTYVFWCGPGSSNWRRQFVNDEGCAFGRS